MKKFHMLHTWIMNCTANDVTVRDSDGKEHVFKASGTVAKVSCSRLAIQPVLGSPTTNVTASQKRYFNLFTHGLQDEAMAESATFHMHIRNTVAEPINMPPPQHGVLYIVTPDVQHLLQDIGRFDGLVVAPDGDGFDR